jgi:hypothetical protein
VGNGIRVASYSSIAIIFTAVETSNRKNWRDSEGKIHTSDRRSSDEAQFDSV